MQARIAEAEREIATGHVTTLTTLEEVQAYLDGLKQLDSKSD